ncbi:hypothetical protein C0J52_13320 [Blattella germanica]|nr:hypothetical protein C0J52_13320 [Blattella germanica]
MLQLCLEDNLLRNYFSLYHIQPNQGKDRRKAKILEKIYTSVQLVENTIIIEVAYYDIEIWNVEKILNFNVHTVQRNLNLKAI